MEETFQEHVCHVGNRKLYELEKALAVNYFLAGWMNHDLRKRCSDYYLEVMSWSTALIFFLPTCAFGVAGVVLSSQIMGIDAAITGIQLSSLSIQAVYYRKKIRKLQRQ